MKNKSPKEPAIGVVLGSGAARGWAHIGVMRALDEAGVRPVVVCGSSIGAMVGAAHAVGNSSDLEQLARDLTRRDLIRLLDVRLSAGGLLGGEKLMRLLHEILGGATIEDLPVRFAATAANIRTGEEVWLRQGPLAERIRASIAFPGILSPIAYNSEHLVDGGLVNPVPVSLCRALGAEIVIAVNINSNRIGRRSARKERRAKARSSMVERWSAEMPEPLRAQANRLAQQLFGEPARSIEFWDVLVSALNIMQEELTRSRLREHAPDFLIEPSVHQIGLLEFHRAEEAIYYGQQAVERVIPDLRAAGAALDTAAPVGPSENTTNDAAI